MLSGTPGYEFVFAQAGNTHACTIREYWTFWNWDQQMGGAYPSLRPSTPPPAAAVYAGRFCSRSHTSVLPPGGEASSMDSSSLPTPSSPPTPTAALYLLSRGFKVHSAWCNYTVSAALARVKHSPPARTHTCLLQPGGNCIAVCPLLMSCWFNCFMV